MSIPTADDYTLGRLDELASTVLLRARNLRHRGKGPAALIMVTTMRKDLRDALQALADTAMAWGDKCLLLAEAEPAPPPGPPKQRRRSIERIPKKRRK
jgi:hypothetical protein